MLLFVQFETVYSSGGRIDTKRDERRDNFRNNEYDRTNRRRRRPKLCGLAPYRPSIQLVIRRFKQHLFGETNVVDN